MNRIKSSLILTIFLASSVIAQDRGYAARNLEQIGLAWTAANYVAGALWSLPGNRPEPVANSLVPEPTPVNLTPVSLPEVEVGALTAGQKTLWSEVGPRFQITAAHVHQARVQLAQLSQRLERQRMSLHAHSATNAALMQSFLEEAASLIRSNQFEQAREALKRADYTRTKLQHVTGQ